MENKNKILNEINNIQSLMDRIDTPITGYEALLKEAKDFSGRVRFNTVLELLEKKYHNGWFMGMGYIKILPLLKKVNVRDENRAKGVEVLGLSDDEIASTNKYKYNPDKSQKYEKMGDWRGNLDNLLNGKEWNDTLSSGKKTFNRPDYLPKFLIVLETYRWHWEPREKYKNIEKNKRNDINGIRKRYGFGSEGLADDDWRVQYDLKKSNRRGSTYTDNSYADYNLFGDTNEDGTPRYDEKGYQKLAMKQHVAVNESLPLSTNYYQVNQDGSISRIPYQYALFLTKHLGNGSNRSKGNVLNDISNEIKTDEERFREEMSKYNSEFPYQYKQWIIDEMAYITATVTDDEGNKTQGYWVNDRILTGEANQDDVIRMISNEVKLSYDYVKLGQIEELGIN